MDKRDWEATGPGISWGEVTPCEHLVQIYEDIVAV
jgi:hypothetical protein